MASDSNSANETFAASEDDLHEEGRKLGGCHDFGDPSYPNGLRALSGALDDSKTLSGLGRMNMRRQIVTSRLEGGRTVSVGRSCQNAPWRRWSKRSSKFPSARRLVLVIPGIPCSQAMIPCS